MKSMGCVSTRPELEENSRIFRVVNVDTSGHHLRRGRLEITDSQLIFHQKGGGVVIRWPLTCLRRYGFDSEIFSFECGRRCATGSGVYGFKCRRAEALFTMLQESINHPPPQTTEQQQQPPITLVPVSSNGVLPSSPTVDESGYLEPITSRLSSRRNNNNRTVSPGGYVSIHESPVSEWPLPRCCSLGAHHYVNNEVIEQESAEQPEESTYVNSAVVSPLCRNSVDINTNYAKLDDLLKQEQHFYVNVKPDRTSPPHKVVAPTEQPNEVNYAELDLDATESGQSNPNSLHSLTSSPAKSPEGYAQIDFDKTVALSNSANPYPSFNDDSMRKTRHNAVIPSP